MTLIVGPNAIYEIMYSQSLTERSDCETLTPNYCTPRLAGERVNGRDGSLQPHRRARKVVSGRLVCQTGLRRHWRLLVHWLTSLKKKKEGEEKRPLHSRPASELSLPGWLPRYLPT